MIRFLFSFSGRTAQGPYALLTLMFATFVWVAAWHRDQSFAAFPMSALIDQPWQTLGAALDDVIRIPSRLLDAAVSLTVGLLLWPYLALTVRRLRDIGQSPWWSLLILLGGVTVPVMVVLSMTPSAAPRSAGSAEPTPVST